MGSQQLLRRAWDQARTSDRWGYCTSSALQPGQATKHLRDSPTKQVYRHLLQSFSRGAQMRQPRKATTPIATAAVNTSAFNKSWVRNTPPASTEEALLTCWPPQKPTLKWSSVHCQGNMETLSWKRKKEREKPDLFYVAHTNNWLYLSHKKPFRDSRK